MLISDVLAIFFLSYLRFWTSRLRVELERRTEAQIQLESSNNIRCPTRSIESDGQPDSNKTQPDGHSRHMYQTLLSIIRLNDKIKKDMINDLKMKAKDVES
jgi:hypothetical protein